MSMTHRLALEMLGLLAEVGPASAYRLRVLSEERLGRRIPPPLIYRALDKLAADGAVARLPTTRRYTLVQLRAARTVAFSCRICGRTALRESEIIRLEAQRLATEVGFAAEAFTLEVTGECSECRAFGGRLAD